MGHYAKIKDGIVVNVIVADYDFIKRFSNQEKWVKTSYNTRGGVHYKPGEHNDFSEPSDTQEKALRKNFAGIGHIYDEVRDAFYEPKPEEFPSWVLNEDTCIWEPPIPYPDDGNYYLWNEEEIQWEQIPLNDP